MLTSMCARAFKRPLRSIGRSCKWQKMPKTTNHRLQNKQMCFGTSGTTTWCPRITLKRHEIHWKTYVCLAGSISFTFVVLCHRPARRALLVKIQGAVVFLLWKNEDVQPSMHEVFCALIYGLTCQCSCWRCWSFCHFPVGNHTFPIENNPFPIENHQFSHRKSRISCRNASFSHRSSSFSHLENHNFPMENHHFPWWNHLLSRRS